jgi:WD40 repeat protein
MLITGGTDGQVLLWTCDEMKFIKKINHISKNEAFTNNLLHNMDTAQKAKLLMSSNNSNTKISITSLCIFGSGGHICVGSSDNSVTVYDLNGTLVSLYFLCVPMYICYIYFCIIRKRLVVLSF